MSAPPTLHGGHFEAMGTVVSLAAPAPLPAGRQKALAAEFERLEALFSMYRPDSEAARVGRGTLDVRDASDEYRDALQLALDWQQATDGAFTPFAPDVTVDLTGVVKALAVESAAGLLVDVPDWSVNVGGDALVAGRAGGRPWVAGIVDPFDRGRLLTKCVLDEHRAVATSGVAERGEHVWRRDEHFAQVSVVADDIVTADVLATAILAGGPATLDLAVARWPVAVIAIARDGAIRATDAFRRAA